jgi:ABC-type sulfate/molybdate transport systems ATPase subunit
MSPSRRWMRRRARLCGRDLLDLQRTFKLPVIFITHDFGEAYLLADQLAVLVEGKLLQCANAGRGGRPSGESAGGAAPPAAATS